MSHKDTKRKEEAFPLGNLSELPEDIVFEIFKHLKLADICRAGRVCRKWYSVSRSPTFWRHIEVEDSGRFEFVELLPFLRPFATKVWLGSRCVTALIPLSLPEVMSELGARCPLLRELVIENAALVCAAKNTTKYLYEYIIDFTIVIDADDESGNYQYPFLRNLHLLSLRKTIFDTLHFFSSIHSSHLPQIRVLDMTSCLVVTPDVTPSLSHLEELYLAGSSFSDSAYAGNFLNSLTNLKILDLEATRLRRNVILQILRGSCQSLEKLFLGHLSVVNSSLFFDGGCRYPRLKVLCLRNTFVTSLEVEALLTSSQSLSSILLTKGCILEKHLNVLDKLTRGKLKFLPERQGYCDHFKENHVYD